METYRPQNLNTYVNVDVESDLFIEKTYLLCQEYILQTKMCFICSDTNPLSQYRIGTHPGFVAGFFGFVLGVSCWAVTTLRRWHETPVALPAEG